MPRILYVTSELPYFPGQGGLMSLHVRHLAEEQLIGVVGPRYPHQPESALQKLRDTVQYSYWWPEHPLPGPMPELPVSASATWKGLKYLPKGLKLHVLRRLTGLAGYSDDAVAWRIALINLAPKILEALSEKPWNVVLLAQSTSASWLPFLPASLARCVYFHDIRSDYLQRSPVKASASNLRRVSHEEREAAQRSDAVAFVSELDRSRATKLLQPACPAAVAPICLDFDYFAFKPAPANTPPVVLFSGHLAHPPNVDAVLHFLDAIWPHIRAAVPEAVCRIVGLHPLLTLVAAAARTPQVELIPNVPDIRASFESSRVYVVPMRYGGGVRQKILEAWAVGLPVVATTMGAEGIAAEDGINCWLRDAPSAFAAQVVALLRNPVPIAVLQAARKLVETQHSVAASGPHLAHQLEVATQRRRRTSPRILYDLRWLVPGKVGGVEQMTRELVDEIADFDRSFEYRFQGSQNVLEYWRFPGGFSPRLFYPDGASVGRQAWRDGLAEKLAADLALPPLMSPALRALEWYTRMDFTVVHGLAGVIQPDLRRFPSVVTMHDLQHLHRPEFFSAADVATREHEYRESCRLARRVICVSEFTRQDVHQRYGEPLDKLTTIWNLPPRLTASALTEPRARQLLGGMGVQSPYIFYPAQPWLHKNHRGLLEAMQLAEPSLPKNHQLVMTGQPFPADHPAAGLLHELTARKRVIHLGYRSPEEVSALYHGAEAMLFPSLFEGFGMPVIEAMQQRCPVVCGQHTSLPEIAGEAAWYTDVAAPDALADAILRITRDPQLRDELRNRGTANLVRFDRRSLAEKTRAIYASIHDEHFA